MTSKKVVKLVHQEKIAEDRVKEWIDANALPGDTVVVTDPDTGDKTHHFVQE